MIDSQDGKYTRNPNSTTDDIDGQMNIFDFIPKTESKPKEIGAKCSGCKYKIYLHNGGHGRQSCEKAGDCEYTPRGWTYDRDGTLHEAPRWMKAERCETCRFWEILPIEVQPPDGWGVKGQCNCYHDGCMDKGYWTTNQTSYCQDYEEAGK